MRAADVQARVVSGYQGGHLVQPLSGNPFLEMRQSDAHAWVEVWLEGRVGRGWIPPFGRETWVCLLQQWLRSQRSAKGATCLGGDGSSGSGGAWIWPGPAGG